MVRRVDKVPNICNSFLFQKFNLSTNKKDLEEKEQEKKEDFQSMLDVEIEKLRTK